MEFRKLVSELFDALAAHSLRAEPFGMNLRSWPDGTNSKCFNSSTFQLFNVVFVIRKPNEFLGPSNGRTRYQIAKLQLKMRSGVCKFDLCYLQRIHHITTRNSNSH